MLNPLINYVDNNSARKKKNNAMEASLCFEAGVYLTYSKQRPRRERTAFQNALRKKGKSASSAFFSESEDRKASER